MKFTTGLFSCLTLSLLIFACTETKEPAESDNPQPESLTFKNYDNLQSREVLVVGTIHFDKNVLESDQQKDIQLLVDKLAAYQPTKVILEWEPHRQANTNKNYRSYLEGTFDISKRYNEVYQLGFRLAKQVGHDSLFLFDDQTPFIGSLEDFSFDALSEYAEQHDAGFYDLHLDSLINNFNHNQELLTKDGLAKQITWLNSPEHQHINAQRMHLFEVRIGIQDNWIGPDWLGRWYQRNVRMMSNVLKFSEPGDRLLIIVGDNHKWVLDDLFRYTPDFAVASSWELLQ